MSPCSRPLPSRPRRFRSLRFRSLRLLLLLALLLLPLLLALALALGMSGCAAASAGDGPDAALPSLRAIWPPQTCGGDGRARIQLRLADSAGVVVLASSPCGEGSLDAPVARVGWYVATALVLDAGDRGRAIATATLAIDGPSVTWRLPW